MKRALKNKGFTMVEVIVVCVLIVVLAGLMGSILVPAIRNANKNGRLSESVFVGNTVGEFIRDELTFAAAITVSAAEPADGGFDRRMHVEDGKLTVKFGENEPYVLYTADFYFDMVLELAITEIDGDFMAYTIRVTRPDGEYFNTKFTFKNINLRFEGIKTIRLDGVALPLVSGADGFYIYYKR